jgi:hypothetical protein
MLVAHELARAGGGGPGDRVADHGGSIAVLEVGAARPDLAVLRDRLQEMVELVYERVLVAEDVAGRPPGVRYALACALPMKA